MPDLLDQFAQAAARHPDKIALVDGKGRKITFAALNQRINRLAGAWHRQGIRAGDKVLLAMSVDADLYAALAALWMLGATAVLPEPAMGLSGLRHAASVTNARAFCSSGVFGLLKWVLPELWPMLHLRPGANAGPLPNLAPPSATDIALISFTSGTTGKPKAIPRSHDFLEAQHQAIAPLLHSQSHEIDLVAFPVFVLINLASARTSVLPNWKMSRLEKLDPNQMQNWIKTQNVTRALLPPSLCDKLVASPFDDNLHTIFTGGGPVFPDLIDALKAVKPSLRVICVYGSTEAEPISHLDTADITGDDRADMITGNGLLVGKPVDDISLRISNQEIQVAGGHVNRRYLNPSHDVENKIHEGHIIWHRTGDAGHLDKQGRLWLLGRMNTHVHLKGRQTYPFSIEVAVRQWPGVKQCALMAYGPTVCLFIEGEIHCQKDWHTRAAKLAIDRVTHIAKMPMDKRHASKIDRKALMTLAAA